MHRDMSSAGGSWGAGDREPQEGQEEEPERQAEAGVAWHVHTQRLAPGWAGQGHVRLGVPNIPFGVTCLEVVCMPFPSPPVSLWDA